MDFRGPNAWKRVETIILTCQFVRFWHGVLILFCRVFGVACCLSFIRNSYCTGDVGKATSASRAGVEHCYTLVFQPFKPYIYMQILHTDLFMQHPRIYRAWLPSVIFPKYGNVVEREKTIVNRLCTYQCKSRVGGRGGGVWARGGDFMPEIILLSGF